MRPIRHLALLARRSVQPVPHLAFRFQRSLSSTPQLHARIKRPSELGAGLGSFEEVANLPAIRKLLSSPEAVKALEEVQRLMHEKGMHSALLPLYSTAGRRTGIDPTTGPTTMQLFQLLSNAEFRQAGKKLKEELEKAGVDLADQVSWPGVGEV